ncbi:hypothetical protein SH2C18_28070 [Clostridium sediminicola]|uniref:hypothetical protein n=1 Tax=Clostridium sediminicola TaxID=3114879 RepID=UPI0031F1F6AF
MKLKSSLLILIIFVVLFGGILVSKSLGWWQTESSKQPKIITSGKFEGMPDPEDIRGSYSFKDIENAFGVKSNLLAEAFNIDTVSPDELKAKDLESIYSDLGDDIEIGTGAVKLFVSFYTGLPYEGYDYLPTSAIDVLKEEGKWTSEMENLLGDRIVELKEENRIATIDKDESSQEEDHDDEIAVKGKTTVSEVISWGIDKETIEEIVGIEIQNVNLTVRDICQENGVSFSGIKDQLNSLLEQ